MAVTEYLILGGKRYVIVRQETEPSQTKRQAVRVTVGGVTRSQQFGFTDYAWSFVLRVPWQVTDSNYGTLSDLRTAYAASSAAFIDRFGTNQGSVYFLGEFKEKCTTPALDGANAQYEVLVNLRKVQS